MPANTFASHMNQYGFLLSEFYRQGALLIEAALEKLTSNGIVHMCISQKMMVLRPPKPISIRSANEDALYFGVLRQSNERVEALRLQREQAFLAEEPNYVDLLELEQIRCPLHLNQFKHSLNKLLPGQTLKLTSKALALVKDLESACKILGIESKVLRYRGLYFLYATQTSVHTAMVYPIMANIEKDEIPSAGESDCVRHPTANTSIAIGE